jgi:hypothetical protein
MTETATETAINSFVIHALDAETLERVRSTGLDASGVPVELVTATGGEPLRCCLRNAREGERCMLFGYQPEIPTGPYVEVGAVYSHALPCTGPASATTYPADWIGRPQVLRAYDARGWIHDTTRVHDGCDPAATIAEMFADPDVVQIHSRNVAWGCYMFRLTRPRPR